MQLENRQLKKKIWSQVFENSGKQSIANTRAERKSSQLKGESESEVAQSYPTLYGGL